MTTRRSSASQQSGSSGGGAAAAASAAAAAPTATGSSKQAGPRTTKRQRLLAPRGRGAAAYREPGPGTIELPGGSSGTVVYRTDLLSGPAAAALFQQLRAELPWEQRDVRVMGRVVAQPRLIAYQADGPELQVRC